LNREFLDCVWGNNAKAATLRFVFKPFLADNDFFAAGLEIRRHLKDADLVGADDSLGDGLKWFFNRNYSTAFTVPK
jgi:hypothetical protein